MKRLNRFMGILAAAVICLTSVLTLAPVTAQAAPGPGKEPTLTNIVKSLGEALNYGVVADTYTQGGHAETSVYVNHLQRKVAEPFMVSGRAHFAASDFVISADITIRGAHGAIAAPGMQFAVFKKSGSSYVRVSDIQSVTTGKIEASDQTAKAVTITGLEFAVTSPADKKAGLYVMQVDEYGDPIANGDVNTDKLIVQYGDGVDSPLIPILGTKSGNYIGDITFAEKGKTPPQEYIKIMQESGDTMYSVMNSIDFGKKINLYGKDGNIYTKIEPAVTKKSYNDVYIHQDDWEGSNAYAKFSNVAYVYHEGDSTGHFTYNNDPVEFSFNNEEKKADKLLEDAARFSGDIAKLGGTCKKAAGVKPEGGSNGTVSYQDTATGTVTTVYRVGVTGGNVDLSSLGSGNYANQGLPISDNEYVIINVVVPSGVSSVNTSVLQLQTADSLQKPGNWQNDTNPQADAYARLIWNYVTEDGKPYEGEIIHSACEGGLMLAPKATVNVTEVADASAFIVKKIENKPELHQTLLNRRTMVKTAVNMWPTGGFRFRKTSKKYTEYQGFFPVEVTPPLSDAEFILYTDPVNPAESTVMTLTSDEDGEFTYTYNTFFGPGTGNATIENGFVVADGLPTFDPDPARYKVDNRGNINWRTEDKITYYLKETKAPAGYALPENNDPLASFTLDSGKIKDLTTKPFAGKTETVGTFGAQGSVTYGYLENEFAYGDLDITKSVKGNTSPDTEYTVTVSLTVDDLHSVSASFGGYSWETEYQIDVTGKKKVKFENTPWTNEFHAELTLKDGQTLHLYRLPMGTYSVREKQGTDKSYVVSYLGADGRITDTGTPKAQVINRVADKTGGIRLTKMESFNGKQTAAAGVQFDIYDQYGRLTDFSMVTDANGEAKIAGLPFMSDTGKTAYYLVEPDDAGESLKGAQSFTVAGTTTSLYGLKVEIDPSSGSFNTSGQQTDGSGNLYYTPAGDNGTVIDQVTYGALKLTKDLVGETAQNGDFFTFEIGLKPVVSAVCSGDPTYTCQYYIYTGNGSSDGYLQEEKSGTLTMTASDGILKGTVELPVGKEIRIMNLPTGTYTVTETGGRIGGKAVDLSQYEVTSSAGSESGNRTVKGMLPKISTYGGAYRISSTVSFTNSLKKSGKGTVILKVRKEIDGISGSTEDFTFTLTGEAGAPMPAAGEQTVTVKQNNTGAFGVITFDKTGTYTYTVTETAGNTPGYTYDTEAKTVKIKVTADKSGSLKAKVSGDGCTVTDNTVTVVNTYKGGSGDSTKVTLSVKKEITGISGSTEDFTFTLTGTGDAPMPADAAGKTVTVKQGNTGSFGEITFDKAGTYTYTITETAGTAPGYSYDMTGKAVTVKVEEKDGKLQATVSGGEGFDAATKTQTVVNTYAAGGGDSTEVTLSVKKEITGISGSTDEFAFTLAGTGDAPMPADAAGKTVTVKQDKTGSFGKITFTKAGTWTYTITETAGTAPGYSYDTAGKTVTVKVEEKDGKLQATVSGGEGFDAATKTQTVVNIYAAGGGDSTEVALRVKKEITGISGSTEDFTFTLTGESGAPMPADAAGKAVTVKQDQTAAFGTILYTGPGTWNYTITEKAGTVPGYAYDTAGKKVTVKVTDEGGTLQATVTGGDGFDSKSLVQTVINTYQKEQGGLYLRKVDRLKPEIPLKGAVYAVYSAVGCTESDWLFDMPATDANGESRKDEVVPGSYFVKEKIAPEGYELEPEPYPVTVEAGKTAKVGDNGTVSDWPLKSGLYLRKVDREHPEIPLKGAVYAVYSAVGCTESDWLFDMPATDANGESMKEDVAAGTYYVKEKIAPEGYELEPKPYTVKVEQNRLAKVGEDGTVSDLSKKGSLSVSEQVQGSKADTNQKFGFRVTFTGDNLPDTFVYTSDTSGQIRNGEIIYLQHDQTALFENLPVGTEYKVEEIEDTKYTVSSYGEKGTIAYRQTSEAKFVNTYKDVPRTGDRTPVLLWMLLAVIMPAAGVTLLRRRRHHG